MNTEQTGPSSRTFYYCNGCKFLKTKDWEFYGEDDEVDRGTDADCQAMDNKNISTYWHRTSTAPDWCPYLPKK